MEIFFYAVLPLFFAFAISVFVLAVVLGLRHRKKLAAVAARLGLRFSPKDPFGLPEKYGDMLAFNTGFFQTAYHTMYGELDGCFTIATEYRYDEGGEDDDTIYRTYCLLLTGKEFHHLQVRPENFMDKIAGWIGFDDIDFEYKEFNDACYVRCDNKKFAYDVVHPKMMEYLLANRGLYLEMFRDVILVHYGRQIAPDEYEPLIRTAHNIYHRLPSYV